MQYNSEPLNELVAGVKQGIRCQHPLKINTFIVFQQLRYTKEQPGHVASEQPALGLAKGFRRTPACNHPAHGGALAEVTQLFNFTSELAAVAAPIGPR
jgi:hypothetical protein